jgi:hypothetical protein
MLIYLKVIQFYLLNTLQITEIFNIPHSLFSLLFIQLMSNDGVQLSQH